MAAAEKGDEEHPQRPAASKPGLLKGRQHSTGSMTIKFNTAMGECDSDAQNRWDDPTLEFGLDARELLVSQSILHDVDVCSKSAPVSEVTTPDPEVHYLEAGINELSPVTTLPVTSQMNQGVTRLPVPPSSSHFAPDSQEIKVVASERSFISGIKERIQGMQDPLQAFTGKIEDFIVEKGIMDPRKSRKAVGESADVKSMINSRSNSKLSDLSKRRIANHASGEQSSTDNFKANNELFFGAVELQDLAMPKGETNQENDDSSKLTGKMDNFSKHRPASFDLSGDYYEVEDSDYADAPVFDEYSQIGVFPKSCSMDTINRQLASTMSKESPKKIKATLQKLIQPIAGRSHAPPVKPPTTNQDITVSLSGLLNNNPIDGEEGSVSADSDQFCDPQAELVSLSPKSLTPSSESAVGLPPEANIPVCGVLKQPADPHPRKMAYYPSKQKLFAVFVVVLAYMVMPLPAYVAGMISGAVIATAAIFAYLWWKSPPKAMEPFILPELSSLPPMEVPEMKESRNEDNEFKVSFLLSAVVPSFWM